MLVCFEATPYLVLFEGKHKENRNLLGPNPKLLQDVVCLFFGFRQNNRKKTMAPNPRKRTKPRGCGSEQCAKMAPW